MRSMPRVISRPEIPSPYTRLDAELVDDPDALSREVPDRPVSGKDCEEIRSGIVFVEAPVLTW